MYEAYFHLLKRPFAATPDPSCFFAPEPVQEVVDELVLRAESGQGICLLSAPAGTGKTLVCRRIAAELSGRLSPLFLANANFPTRRALLQSMLFELGLRYSGLEEQELRLAVYAALRRSTQAGRGAVLIVDEAHLLNDRLLEELRLLASLAEEDQPLARVILAGQPALEERLISPALEALNQRIVCQAYLDSLTREQSINYVKFRIEWAGGDSSTIFTPNALERIALACNGLPRCLNQLGDHVLLLAYVQELPRVTEEAVDEALRDLKQLPLNWNTPVTADPPGAVLEESDAFHDVVDDAHVTTAEEGPASFRAENAERSCIEIGSPTADVDSAEDAESLADYSYLLPASQARPASGAPAVAMSEMLARQRREVVPAADPLIMDTRGFDEEPVADKYAALDRRLPRFSRTFEDAAVPESWLPPRHAVVPAAPRPPALPTSLDDEADVSEQVMMEEPRPEQSIEAQLGAQILDACLEVQTAIGQWREPATSYVSSIEAAHGPVDAIEGEPAAVSNTDYDVIEPEAAAVPARGSDALREEPAVAAPTGRYVPKPKYRHVFSTLRRRLRGGNGRKA
jgi:type II secretory pathway predicted ATPase ExeA